MHTVAVILTWILGLGQWLLFIMFGLLSLKGPFRGWARAAIFAIAVFFQMSFIWTLSTLGR